MAAITGWWSALYWWSSALAYCAYLALVVLVVPARAEPAPRCGHRLELSGGVGVWSFGAPPLGDTGGLGIDLAVQVAPSCGRWIIGGRGSSHAQLRLDLGGTREDRKPLGISDLGPMAGLSLREGRLGVVALAGPALSFVRPDQDGLGVTIGIATVLGISLRLTETMWIGPQWSTNINATRSATAYFLQLERIVSR